MQPTVSPWAWVSSWERRARTRAAGARAAGEYARDRDRAATRARDHDKYAFYGLRKDGRHFIRLDPLTKGLLLNRQWAATIAPVTWHVERFHRTQPWALPDIKSIQSYRPFEPVPIVLPRDVAGAPGPQAGPPRAPGPAHGWSYGARGWAAGAVVLALLVLLVRAAENCLHKKLFRAIYAHTNSGAAELQQNDMRPGHYRLQGVRRQESEEWSTPNVMATSLQLRDFEAGSVDNMAAMRPLPPRDPPPPYSACAARKHEEPPPPYSACDPKSTDPQVHIRRHHILDDRPHSSTDVDNAQNNLIENGLRSEAATTNNSDDSDAAGIRTELIFDNGRIVERMSLDLNSNNNEAGSTNNGNIEGENIRHADLKDRVVYVNETATENATPSRALLV